jgi:hypothetical protein
MLVCCTAAAGGDRPTSQLFEWDQGLVVTAPDDADMKMYVRFYEWNMFEAVAKGEHSGGDFTHVRRVSRNRHTAVITSRDMRLAVKTTPDGATLLLTATNRSDHDWPELAAIVPCFSPGPERIRNQQFANTNTYFVGPNGLILLIERQIHFNQRLRPALVRISPERQFMFSEKWPTSEIDTGRGIIIRESTDRKWVSAIAWDDFLSVQGHNPWQCMHVSVRLGPLKRGSTKVVRGRIYLFPGNKDECLKRYLANSPSK